MTRPISRAVARLQREKWQGHLRSEETIHTTANHPWLTADRGWVLAGELHSGEQIVREGGAAPATVTALRVVAGAADYYNLTVSVLHTYAVGSGHAVVHNCPDVDGGSGDGPPIKRGSAGGPGAGKPFSRATKSAASRENGVPPKCVFCRLPPKVIGGIEWPIVTDVDHVIPVSLGGNNTLENAQMVCDWCNTSKGNTSRYPKNPPPDYKGDWPPPWWPDWLFDS